MKTPLAIAAFAISALASPAWADHHQQDTEAVAQDQEAPLAEVIERDENGRATRIRVEGFEYDVCSEDLQDGCINPREAGLDFGDVPIDYWPGRPASEIDHPLPQHAPEAPKDEG